MRVAAGLALTAVALAGLGVLWWTTRGGPSAHEDPAAPGAQPESDARPAELARTEVEHHEADPAVAAVRDRAASTTPKVVRESLAASGSVRVTVRWREPSAPASGIHVRALSEARASAVAFPREGTTGANGVALLERVPLGPVTVRADRSGEANGEVREGGALELDLVLERGLDLRGRTLDPDGRPVAQAQIQAFRDASDRSGAEVAVSDNSGAFTLTGIASGTWLQARSREHAPSATVLVAGPASPVELTLSLGGRGATLLGQVLDPDEAPIAGAAVCAIPDSGPNGGVAPRPWFACTTDAEGRFAFPSLELGRVRLVALFEGLAPYDEVIQLVPARRDERILGLTRGAGFRGKVHFEDGAPAAGVTLRFGDGSEFLEIATRSLADGSFVLRGLPSGAIAVEVGGKVLSAKAGEGELASWDPVIPRHQ